MSVDTEGGTQAAPEFPEAVVRQRRASGVRFLAESKFWWVTLVCAVVAIALVVVSMEGSGPRITIRFADGHGLKPGDSVRHLGIDVGQVRSVELSRDIEGVSVVVELEARAAGLSRRGTRFWIVRPELRFPSVSGLETIVGAKYIGVEPGPRDAPMVKVFEGLDRAPAVLDRAEGGLEIILESSSRSGLEPGAPVTYRGISVGRITSVGLASDAANVEARAYIGPEFRVLVRENTAFWSISGFAVDLGFTGISMDVESLATIAAGGVALATPDPPGAPVTTGDRFRLHATPEPSWLRWQPRLAVGSTLLPDGLALPRPMRAALRWKERNYVGLMTERQRDGWVLALDGGRLIGPADLLAPVEGAKEGSTRLALAGEEFPVVDGTTAIDGRIAVYRPGLAAEGMEAPWPSSRLRTPDGPEDCIVVGDAGDATPLSVGRLETSEEGVWAVDPSIPLEADRHGASVVARGDGSVIGVLVIEKSHGLIVPFRPPGEGEQGEQ